MTSSASAASISSTASRLVGKSKQKKLLENMATLLEKAGSNDAKQAGWERRDAREWAEKLRRDEVDTTGTVASHAPEAAARAATISRINDEDIESLFGETGAALALIALASDV